MPQTMTAGQAREKICPFTSPYKDNRFNHCRAGNCACWGWSDPEEGQKGHWNDSNSEKIETYSFDKYAPLRPEGKGWNKVRTDVEKKNGGTIYKTLWSRATIIGPRRGQCEAMSPYIEVTGP